MELLSKVCTRCGEDKPLHQFNLSPEGKLGRKSICKSCTSSHLKRIRDSKPKEVKVRNDLEKRKERFLKRAHNKYGEKFEYSVENYLNDETKIEIFCKEHRVKFWQSPAGHLRGVGCDECVSQHVSSVRTKSQEDVIAAITEVHGDTYCYSDVVYKGDKEKIHILCKSCGKWFWQRASSHIAGCGCPTCAGYGYSPNKPGSVYLLASGNIVKVGITNRKVKDRVKEIEDSSGLVFEVLVDDYSDDGAVALAVESSTHLWMREIYAGVENKFDGYTECFIGADAVELAKHIKRTAALLRSMNANH